MKILLFVFALWCSMYIDPSDGRTITRKLGNCRKNEYKTAVFPCPKKCNIKVATVRFKKGGNVDIIGRDGRRLFTPLLCGRKCFCRGFTRRRNFERCFKKRGHKIRKGLVSFVMKCRKPTRNVRITVNGNVKPSRKRPTTTDKTIPGVVSTRLKDMPQTKDIKVVCEAPSCGNVSFEVSKGSGCIRMDARFFTPCGRKNTDTVAACAEKNIVGIKNWHVLANTFEISVWSLNSNPFRNARLTLKMEKTDTKASVTELPDDEGISTLSDKSNKQYVQIKSSGDRFPSLTQVVVSCSGNCRNIELSLIRGNGNMTFFGSDGEPALINKNGCYNSGCFCYSKYPGSSKCRNAANKEKFDLTSDKAFIGLVPDPRFEEVVAHIKGDNIIWGSKMDLLEHDNRVPLPDDSLLVPVVGPLKKGEHAHFVVTCFTNSQCTNSRLEVIPNGHFNIRAGTSTYKDQLGNCRDCKCNDESSCGSTFRPYANTFYVTLEALNDFNDNYAYLKFFDSDKDIMHSYCQFKGETKLLSDTYRYAYVPQP